MNDAPLPVLTLYGHSYCHLCFEMLRALERLRPRLAFALDLVDIEGRPELEERFGERVPVLWCDGVEVCHYVLDEPALIGRLARGQGAAGPGAPSP